jgi:hypothetical protein
MCPAKNEPANCKFRAVIRFLHAKHMSAMKIHRELCAIYDQNVMSEGTVRQGCRMFKYGPRNVHDEEQTGWRSVVSDG